MYVACFECGTYTSIDADGFYSLTDEHPCSEDHKLYEYSHEKDIPEKLSEAEAQVA